MESLYGIGVQNRYEMFYDDDSDPVELLKKSQAKKKEKPIEKEIKTKETPKKQDKPINSNIPDKRNDVNHKDAPEKKDFKRSERTRFTDREERNNKKNTSDVVKESKDKEGQTQRFNGESRGRGRGNAGATTYESGRGTSRGRGRGRGNWTDRGGKREFDRQSGMVTSGVKSVDKKEGAGSFNWGSNKEQISNHMDRETEQENETSDNPDKAKEPGSETKENDSPKEEEPKEMTLDEWKASQKRDAPQFNLRKAGEGENSAQWKKTYVLKKKETEEGDETSGDAAEPDAPQGKRKVLLPIDFQFADAPMRGRFRGRGGRGAPGANRGGRGRGFRGAGGRFATRAEAPKMDDEKVFPSLG